MAFILRDLQYEHDNNVSMLLLYTSRAKSETPRTNYLTKGKYKRRVTIDLQEEKWSPNLPGGHHDWEELSPGKKQLSRTIKLTIDIVLVHIAHISLPLKTISLIHLGDEKSLVLV